MFMGIQAKQKVRNAVSFMKRIHAKKMLLVAGISLLGVFMMGKASFADDPVDQPVQQASQLQVVGQYKKTDLSGWAIYQLKLTDDTYPISKISTRKEISVGETYIDKDNEYILVNHPAVVEDHTTIEGVVGNNVDNRKLIIVEEIPTAEKSEKLVWEESDGGKEVLAVVKVESDVVKLIVENTNGDEQTIAVSEITTHDHSAPVLDSLIKYNSTEYGSYIQAEFHDATKIWKIADNLGNEKVLLKEKQDDNKVTVKYILPEGETEFKIYDILGNSDTISLDKARVTVDFNAKNTDSSIVVFKASPSYTTETGTGTNKTTKYFYLDEIKTYAGEEVTIQRENDIYVHNDGVGTSIPLGTTKLVLKYVEVESEGSTTPKTGGAAQTFTVPLVLDKTGPEGVHYTWVSESVDFTYDINGEEQEGSYEKYTVTKVKGNVRNIQEGYVPGENEEGHGSGVRAYVNNTTKKCIVEVRDIQSGIDKIELCETVTDPGPSHYETIEGCAYESHGNLRASVLHLFDFAALEKIVTGVKVTDGLGNDVFIPVESSTVEENIDTIVAAEIIEEKDEQGNAVYKVVAQDYKAGLWKMERGEGNNILDFSDEDCLNVSGVDIENVKYVYEGDSGEEDCESEEDAKAKCSAEKTVYKKSLEIKYFVNDQEIEEAEVAEQTAPVNKKYQYKVEKMKVENNALVVDEIVEEAMVTIDDDVYEQYTLRKVTRDVDVEGYPVITVYDALGNKRELTFDEIAFACLYATYNGDNALAVNIKETRGIWKVTATRDGEDYILEVFNQNDEPKKLIKTYQVPSGVVSKVTVYNTNADTDLKNEITTKLQSVAEIKTEIENDQAELDKLINVKELATDTNNKITGATIVAKHGIKKVLYVAATDDTMIEFYKDLPTELFVNCMLEDGFAKAIVVDATGCALTIEQNQVTLDYADLFNIDADQKVITPGA